MNIFGWMLCAALAVAGLWDADYWILLGVVMISCALQQYREELMDSTKQTKDNPND